MRRINFEAEYNNRQRVPEHPEIAARWSAASASFREAAGARAELDVAYGEGERQHFDLFHPEGEATAPSPVIAYIHGGYWQRGDRKEYSCIAEPFVADGYRVAIPSYSLCPNVAVQDIAAELSSFVIALYRKTGQRPIVIGHSAGGHLAASLLATDWQSRDGDLPTDLVTRALAISGVFMLRPLIRTSLNDALKLDVDQADAASPALWDAPQGRRRLIAAVGALESREFVRQSLEIVGRWGPAGVTAECVVVPDANHFTILDQLMTHGTGLHARVADLTR
ncbi:MAG: alpha/beta hydrolase [Hyphomicrobiaceae bacterium]